MQPTTTDGIDIGELAELAGVDRSTASRWKSKRARVPLAVLKLLALRVWGEIEQIFGASWHGWRIGRDELLYAPGWRRGFAAHEILMQPMLHARIAALERELAEIARRRRLDVHHAGVRCARARPREQRKDRR